MKDKIGMSNLKIMDGEDLSIIAFKFTYSYSNKLRYLVASEWKCLNYWYFTEFFELMIKLETLIFIKFRFYLLIYSREI